MGGNHDQERYEDSVHDSHQLLGGLPLLDVLGRRNLPKMSNEL